MYLNRAHVEVRQSHQERKEDIGGPIKLDAEAQAHIEKHRFTTLLKIRPYLSLQLNSLILIQYPQFLYCTQPTHYKIHSFWVN
jgi:hypothetical protein